MPTPSVRKGGRSRTLGQKENVPEGVLFGFANQDNHGADTDHRESDPDRRQHPEPRPFDNPAQFQHDESDRQQVNRSYATKIFLIHNFLLSRRTLRRPPSPPKFQRKQQNRHSPLQGHQCGKLPFCSRDSQDRLPCSRCSVVCRCRLLRHGGTRFCLCLFFC